MDPLLGHHGRFQGPCQRAHELGSGKSRLISPCRCSPDQLRGSRPPKLPELVRHKPETAPIAIPPRDPPERSNQDIIPDRPSTPTCPHRKRSRTHHESVDRGGRPHHLRIRAINPHTMPVRFLAGRDHWPAVTKKQPGDPVPVPKGIHPPGHDARPELTWAFTQSHCYFRGGCARKHQGRTGKRYLPVNQWRSDWLLPAQHLLAHHAGYSQPLTGETTA